MKFQYNDGGRSGAGFKGKAGDCVTRAIAIASQRPYREVYNALHEITRDRGEKSPRNGVLKRTSRKYLTSIGWRWVPTMGIGTGCQVHLRSDELPAGRLIVKLSRHMAAVIDGVLHDAFDCSRDGRRCVYGYYLPPLTAPEPAG